MEVFVEEHIVCRVLLKGAGSEIGFIHGVILRVSIPLLPLRNSAAIGLSYGCRPRSFV